MRAVCLHCNVRDFPCRVPPLNTARIIVVWHLADQKAEMETLHVIEFSCEGLSLFIPFYPRHHESCRVDENVPGCLVMYSGFVSRIWCNLSETSFAFRISDKRFSNNAELTSRCLPCQQQRKAWILTMIGPCIISYIWKINAVWESCSFRLYLV